MLKLILNFFSLQSLHILHHDTYDWLLNACLGWSSNCQFFLLSKLGNCEFWFCVSAICSHIVSIHMISTTHNALTMKLCHICPESKVHGANIGPTWVLSAPDGPHVSPRNLVIRVCIYYIWHSKRWILGKYVSKLESWLGTAHLQLSPARGIFGSGFSFTSANALGVMTPDVRHWGYI